MFQMCRAFALVVILGFLFGSSQSLRFDLQSGHTKCISEDIKSNSMTVGKYHVVNPHDGAPLPDSHKITVRVTSASGNSYHYAEHVESGQFAFTSAEPGDYMACFWSDDHKPPTTLTLDFEWKSGVASRDWGSVAKKGSIDERNMFKWIPEKNAMKEADHELRDLEHSPSCLSVKLFAMDTMELEVKKLLDTVNSIHEEMFYLRDREQEMQELNKSTNSKMFWLSFLSLFVCLSVAGLQFWHLKSFFERKKLL
ncbi:hypothetical protein V2J09_015347 [Rumex salicifolius]